MVVDARVYGGGKLSLSLTRDIASPIVSVSFFFYIQDERACTDE